MSNFDSIVAATDQVLLAEFGVAATYLPIGGAPVAIVGMWLDPEVKEETARLSGLEYDISAVDADSVGGAVLKLRRNVVSGQPGVSVLRLWVRAELGLVVGGRVSFA